MYAVTSSYVRSLLSKMPFCPWSQMAHPSRSFCIRPSLHLLRVLTGWSLLMAWVIHDFAFCHSHPTSCKASLSRSPLHRGLHHFPAGGFQLHPQLFLAVFVSRFFQQPPAAEHYAWWFSYLFVLFLLYCLYFKDKDSYLWIPSSHGEVSVVVFFLN